MKCLKIVMIIQKFLKLSEKVEADNPISIYNKPY